MNGRKLLQAAETAVMTCAAGTVHAFGAERRFPLEVMQPHGAIDVIAVIGIDSASKYSIRLLWDDDHCHSNERLVYPTV